MIHPNDLTFTTRRNCLINGKVNPVRGFLAFKPEGSQGALNSVFSAIGKFLPSPLKGAQVSNGVKQSKG